MQLRKTMRQAAKMRLALTGASGAGKTYSSLQSLLTNNGKYVSQRFFPKSTGHSDLVRQGGLYTNANNLSKEE